MIVEMRTYTLAPGSTTRYFALLADKGLAVQTAILGDLQGCYAVEVGDLNRVIHLWGFDSFEDRLLRRARLWSDAAWLAFSREALPIVLNQESQILTPAPFMRLPAPAT